MENVKNTLQKTPVIIIQEFFLSKVIFVEIS